MAGPTFGRPVPLEQAVKWWFKKKMAEEEVKQETAGAETVPSQEEELKDSAERGEGAASTEADAEAKEPAEQGAGAAPAEKPVSEVDWKDQYARLLADFDNFKKRTARDREDIYRYAEADILKDILPTVDNLALALSNAANKDDPFVKGVQMAYDALLKSLKDHEAEPFDSVGKELDIVKMEAIAHLPSPDVEDGKVSIESKKGWMLKGKVLRVAQVVVSAGKPQ